MMRYYHIWNRGKNVKNKTTEYNVINKEIVDEWRQAKENSLNEQCEEIESLEKQYKKKMYDNVKELTKKCTRKGGGSITDKNGKILFDQEEIATRWVEYVKELYDDDQEPMPQFEITSGQSILKEEVEKAIQSMKRGKATGSVEILTEMLRALDDQNIDVITNPCSFIYNSGAIPTDLNQSIFITI